METLRELDILGNFLTIYLQGRQFLWLLVCVAVHEVPLKGKVWLSWGANSFLLE